DYQQEALHLLEEAGDRRGVSEALNVLGMTRAVVDAGQRGAFYSRALPLLRESHARQGLVTDLVMHTLQAGFYWGDTLSPAPLDLEQGERDAQEAVRTARELDWPAREYF